MTETATTEPTSATPVEATIDIHLSAYCEPDVDRRRALVGEVWAEDGRLIDPPIEGAGRDGIVDMVDAVLGLYPGHTFRRSTPVDLHHAVARYGWELLDPDGSTVLAGMDVADLDATGRLVRVVGFFGELTPLGG